MLTRKSVIAVAAVLTIFSAQQAIASGKPTTAPTNSKKPVKTVVSEWLTPKGTDAAPFITTAGATIPLKFRLANGGVEIKSTSGVVVTAAAANCPSTPTPVPTATGNLAVVKQGKLAKTGVLRYSGNSFMYQWKTAQNAMVGCYRFSVTSSAGTLNGPLVRINPGS